MLEKERKVLIHELVDNQTLFCTRQKVKSVTLEDALDIIWCTSYLFLNKLVEWTANEFRFRFERDNSVISEEL